MVLLLVVLAVQLRDSSALPDDNEILIRSVAEEQQQLRHRIDLGIPYRITVAGRSITGFGGRTFQGTAVTDMGTNAATGSLLDNGRLYNETHLFELTRPHPWSGRRVQTILFKNWAGVTVGVWSGTFPANMRAAVGDGSFISP